MFGHKRAITMRMASAARAEISVTRPSERRRAERKLVVIGGTVQRGESKHPCLIRDVSESGLFLYSTFVPTLGEAIQVSLGFVVFQGCVVRVETKDFGAATGVGIRFTPLQSASTVEVQKQA